MRRTYQLLYRIGMTPWTDRQIPTALRLIVEGSTETEPLTPGVAVDLGCGTGEHARYLAAHGWQTTAIDFVAIAIDTARRRDPEGQVTWRKADVTRPDEVDPDHSLGHTAGLILDIGCLHGLTPTERAGWAATLAHLAAPTAALLLRAAPPARRTIGPAGISSPELTTLLGDNWQARPQHNNWHHWTRTPTT
jgi:hypothetical protein